MSRTARLSRIAPSLTAQERAILILEAWKKDRPEDPAWRLHMPPEQARAFNNYIDLMIRANEVLGRIINRYASQAELLEERLLLLLTETCWVDHVEEIERAIRLVIKEPITQSEYDAAVTTACQEWESVGELAGFLAGKRDYSEDDYEEVEGLGRVVKEKVWERAACEEEQRLRSLAEQGSVPSRVKGKRLELHHGVLSRFGHDISAVPEDYGAYRVLPDEQAQEVEAERRLLRRLRRVLDGHHAGGVDRGAPIGMPKRLLPQMRASVAYLLLTTWRKLRIIENLADEIALEFNSVDVLRPVYREKLNSTRERLETIREDLKLLNMNVVLGEPLPQEIDAMGTVLDLLPGRPSVGNKERKGQT